MYDPQHVIVILLAFLAGLAMGSFLYKAVSDLIP